MPIFLKKIFVVVCLFFCIAINGFAQIKYEVASGVNLTVKGTSTLHNWSMESSNGSGNASFIFNTDESLKAIPSLYFSTMVGSLKSKHSGLDKTAYKSLKSDANPTIIFNATSSIVTNNGSENYTLKCNGKLTIAGIAKDAEILATLKLNADKTITVKGTKIINMTDWNITPPSFMLGAMTTGKEVTINYSLTLKK